MNTKKYMLNVLKNHRIYESFTCRDDAGNRIKYDLLAEEPPVGLLHDIAVGETELTVNEKNTAMEMFSALRKPIKLLLASLRTASNRGETSRISCRHIVL